MIPQSVNITDQVNNDTFSGKQFTLKTTSTGAPISLVGASIRCYFRKDSIRGRIVSKKEVGSGFTITDGANGVFQLDAFDIDWGKGNYYGHVEITFTDGTVKTYMTLETELLQDGTDG